MTDEQIKQVIKETPKGANIWVEWERSVKFKKAYDGLPMTKRTRMLCRIGINYDNKAEVKDGRANGELPAQNAGLRGFEWDTFPTLLKATKTGLLYIRLESGTFCAPTTTEFRLATGEVVVKADYEHAMLASEKRPAKEGDLTFNCKAETILRIHRHENVDDLQEIADMVTEIDEEIEIGPHVDGWDVVADIVAEEG